MNANKGALAPHPIKSMKNATHHEIDEIVHRLNHQKEVWAKLEIKQKIHLLEQILEQTIAISDEWVKKDKHNRARNESSFDAASSLLAGPAMSLRAIHAYLRAFKSMDEKYRPQAYGKIRKNLTDQLTIEVFPLTVKDKFLMPGRKLEVWLKPGIDEARMKSTQAKHYQDASYKGKLALVLGAGNYAALTLNDMLSRLFEDNQVVLVKTHPVTEYFGDILEKIFAPLIARDFVHIVHGDAKVGEYLTHHKDIDSILITGSDKTFEHIVFGPQPEQKRNKLQNKPVFNKEICAELGNVSPIIIIPGPWNERDLIYQAKNILSSHAFNGGYSCNASRVLIQHQSWALRDKLNDKIKQFMTMLPQDKAYYPGTKERIEQALKEYPNSYTVGDFHGDKVPWVFAEGIDHKQDQMCFKSEIFGSFFSETTIPTLSTIDFIEKAVAFCNERLWGNLNAMIIVHPNTMNNKRYYLALRRAIRNLKYGTVAVNTWPGFAYYLSTGSWGAYPGNRYNDVQSGMGKVHNPFLFENVEKGVLYAPFHIKPEPLTPFNKNIHNICEHLLRYEQKPSWLRLMRLLFASIKP